MSDERFTSSLPPNANSPPYDADWFVFSQGHEYGPYMIQELEDQAAAGTLGPEDYVRAGHQSWLPASRFPFLVIHMPAGLALRSGAAEFRNPGKSGIGGWLALFAFGLIISPLYVAYAIYEEISFLRGAPPKNLQLALSMEAITQAALLVFHVYVTVAFFRHKSTVPMLVIALLVARVVLDILDSIMVAILVGPIVLFQDTVGTLIPAAIWIPYFLLSQRVKATFTVDANEPLWRPSDSRSDASLSNENDPKEPPHADTAFTKPNR